MAGTTTGYKISGRFAQGYWAHNVNELKCTDTDDGFVVRGAGVEIHIDTTTEFVEPIGGGTIFKGYGSLSDGGTQLTFVAQKTARGRYRIDAEDALWFWCEVVRMKNDSL